MGAGGISNAFPELVDGAGKGATFDLRKVPLEETGLAPKEIWCNESQERYVIALDPDALPLFDAMCVRERCPYAIVGVARDERTLVLEDGPGGERADRHADGTCCSASRPRCTATCSASRAATSRST